MLIGQTYTSSCKGAMNLQQIEDEFGKAVRFDIELRKLKEESKAREKYGDAALAPGGRPEFDVLDFAINEVVGLDRYGEMLRHRFAKTVGTDFDVECLGKAMQEISEILAPHLVACRLALLEVGGALGVTEVNRFIVPDQKHAARQLIPEQ